MGTDTKSTNVAGELAITRTFDAPRELVWQAWTDREQSKQWGPRGFTISESEMELRPGGAWYTVMISPEGGVHRQHGVVREVVALERLVFTFVWDHEPDVEMLVTITLADRGGRTEMTFRQTGFESAAERDGHEEGWNQAFDRMADVVTRS